MTDDRAASVASLFRAALLATDLSQAPGNLPGFPAGCCSWACYFIGAFLKEEMSLDPLRVQGVRGPESHEWIEIGGLTMDITSDQFQDIDAAIVVSRSSRWHETWTVEATRPVFPVARYDRVAKRGQRRPSDIYGDVCRRVRRGMA